MNIVETTSRSNAEACSRAISKVRKTKARERTNYEIEDDSESNHMDLGGQSLTVSIGKNTFHGFVDDDFVETLNTTGLNSCIGVLIVGKKGVSQAHGRSRRHR